VEYGAGGATVSIHDPASYRLQNARWRQMTLVLGIPSVETTFEGHTERFGIDTGFPGSVLFFAPAVERLRLLEGRATVRKVHTQPWSDEIVARYGKIDWTDFEGIHRKSIGAAFATEQKGLAAIPDVAGLLGNELLEPYTVVFDYAHERIAFIPKTSKPGKPAIRLSGDPLDTFKTDADGGVASTFCDVTYEFPKGTGYVLSTTELVFQGDTILCEISGRKLSIHGRPVAESAPGDRVRITSDGRVLVNEH
jgi:hypothetical protein